MKRALLFCLLIFIALRGVSQETDPCQNSISAVRLKTDLGKLKSLKESGKERQHYLLWRQLLNKAPCHPQLLEEAITYYQLQWMMAGNRKDPEAVKQGWKDSLNLFARRHIQYAGVQGINFGALSKIWELLDAEDHFNRLFYYSVWADSSTSMPLSDQLKYLQLLQKTGSAELENRWNKFYTKADASEKISLDSLLESGMDCAALESRFQQLLQSYPDSVALMERMVNRLKESSCTGNALYLQLNQLVVSKESLVDEMLTLAENEAFAGNFEKASLWMQKAIMAEKSPDKKAAFLLRQGEFLLQSGQAERAYLNVKRARQLAPRQNPVALLEMEMQALEQGSRNCPPKFRYLALMKAIYSCENAIILENTCKNLSNPYRELLPDQATLLEMGLEPGQTIKSECWPSEEILVISK